MLTKKNKITTLLFDLDGTLFDTAPDLANALNQLLIRYHQPPLSYETIRPFASTGSPGLLNLAFQIHTSDPTYPELRAEFLDIYNNNLTVETTMFAGMREVLDFIDTQGLRWGVVTNKPVRYAQEILNHYKLNERCACLVGGDMVENSKPAPDSLLLACKMLDIIPQECVYIGDAERDVLAAKRAGMRCIVALYGYIQDAETPETWQADDYFNHPRDILAWVKENFVNLS